MSAQVLCRLEVHKSDTATFESKLIAGIEHNVTIKK